MPTQLLIRSVEECLDAGAFLEEQRERGEALERALERVRCAREELRKHVEEAQDPQVKPLVDTVRSYLAAEAAFEGYAGEVPGPACAFNKLHQARRAVTAQLRAYLLSGGATGARPGANRTRPLPLSRRVLIAIDGSTPSTWAVEFGGQLAETLGAHVMLLHVGEAVTAERNELVYATLQLQDEQRQLRVQWRELLEQAQRALPTSVRCDVMLREGWPVSEIIHVARTWDADLIVMGTRGRGRLTQFLLGSVAEAVIRGASCPVLTVGHEPVRSNSLRNAKQTPATVGG